MEKISNLLGGLAILGVVIFGILLYNSHQETQDALQAKQKYEERLEVAQDSIASLDSANYVLSNKKAEEAKKAKKYRNLWLDTKAKKAEIEAENKKLKSGLDSVSLDSLAKYIIKHYKGESYKIREVNDSVFVGFQDTTVKDIVSTHLDYEKTKEIVDIQDKEIGHLDSLTSSLSKELMYTEGIVDNLKVKVDTLQSVNTFYEDTLADCRQKAIREEDNKKIFQGVSAGLGILAILAALL